MQKEINKIIIYQAALYIRLSKEDGDKEESNSVVNQRNMLLRYLREQEDLELYDTYIDDGYTGTNFERPAFLQMIRDIQDRKVNCVIVKDLSRFGRDYINTGKYIEKYFVDWKVRFIVVNDHIDSLYSQYDMLVPIKNIFNQQYALDISQKVQSAFKVKQKEGQFIGAFASYGYHRGNADKHKLVIDEYAADIVKRIFLMYSQGMGKIRIANQLNEEEICCPSEYKKQCGMNYRNSNKMNTTNYWTFSTVDKILKNQIYCGNMVQGKTKRRMKGKAQYLPQEEWIIIQNTHPAIIDWDLWEQVQTRLKRGTRSIDFTQNVSIFSGLLKCGDCNRALTKNINGESCYYLCATYKNYGTGKCSSHRISQELLEKIVLEDLNSIIALVPDLDALVSEIKINSTYHETFSEKSLERYDNDRNKLILQKKAAYQDYQDEIITKEEYLEYKSSCDKKIELITKKKDAILQKQNKKNEAGTSLWVQRLIENRRLDKLDRNILEQMVDSIYVYDNKMIKMIYKFSNELA